MKKIFLIILFTLACTAVLIAADNKIAWEPVPGAWGYVLEIKDSSDNIILNKEIRDSAYSVAQFAPGEYSFRISTLNMLKQKGENTSWVSFNIEKLYKPQLKSISKKQLISSNSNKNIVIFGKNFRKESTFLLRGNGTEVKLSDVDIISDSEVHIKYTPPVSLNGKYDLVVVNRGDVESVLKDSVEIVGSGESERFYYIGTGYLLSIPVGIWAEYMGPSYTGGELFFQLSLKNLFFENILLETEIDAVQFTNKQSVDKSSLQYLSAGLGAGYYYPFYSLNMQLFFKVSTGPVYTRLTLDKNVVGRVTTSYDWFANGTTGLRIFTGSSFFIEPACSWKTVFYTGEYLHAGEISLSFGFKI